jgi:hypothetical protein
MPLAGYDLCVGVLRQLTPLVAALFLVAGCGASSSGGTTVTVTQGGSSGTASTVDSKRELMTFIALLEPLRDDLNEKTDQVNKAIEEYNENRTLEQANEAGTTAADVAAELLRIVPPLAAIQAPASVNEAYTAYVDSVTTQAHELKSVAFSFRQGDTQAAADAWHRVDDQPLAHFKTVLIHALTLAGIPVPEWVTEVGTRE